MTSGAVVPDLATLRAQAAHRRVVPVTRRRLADDLRLPELGMPPVISTVDRPGVTEFTGRTPEGEYPKAVAVAKEAIAAAETLKAAR